MRPARAAAVVTWVYAAVFGLPVIPVAIHEATTGALPRLWNIFALYSGPWTERSSATVVIELLFAFLVLTLAASFSGWWLFRGRRHGAILNLSVLVAEAFFWFGFALPIALLFGAARIALVWVAWRNLR